jgi:hypothetical protein
MAMIKVLSKVALGFWPPVPAEKRLLESPDPKKFIRIPKDEITEVPDWVIKDKAFQWAHEDGNVVMLQDVPKHVVAEKIGMRLEDLAPPKAPVESEPVVKRPRK